MCTEFWHPTEFGDEHVVAMAQWCGVAGPLGDDRFEHKFGIDVGGYAVFVDGFTGGRSDWYHFSIPSRTPSEDYRHHMRDLELNC
ncbi:hypothetical protein LX88_006247 [Lentzea californiensis]|nr:hypothetical protein [Lentzea californiensis]